ncbi:MAG TPA: TlpA disulfide reductase family protein [Haliangium sp.]|nr:TlpA disulfide reductase family protein [Haliangium sp.]
MRNIAFIGVVGAAALALFFALSSSVSHEGVKVGIRSAEACSATRPAECLPDLSYIDTDGTAWTREGLANKVVMINFWATWCAPCKAEIPALTATYQRHAGEDFVLLGVMMDSDDVSEQALTSFVQSVGLDYPVVPIDSDIWSAFDAPEALPMTFIYDRAGKLRLRHRGALSEGQLENVVKELLAEPAPGV